MVGGTKRGAVAALLAGGLLAGCGTDGVTAVSDTGAVLHGSARTNGKPLAWWFQYATSASALGTDAGRESTHETLPSFVRTEVDLAARVSGLRSASTYAFRLCTKEEGGTTGCFPSRTFTTLAAGRTGPDDVVRVAPGAPVSVTVPAGVHKVVVDLSAGAGGSALSGLTSSIVPTLPSGADGGRGATVHATVAVTPGERLEVRAGHRGAAGGAVPGPTGFGAGGGGGAGPVAGGRGGDGSGGPIDGLGGPGGGGGGAASTLLVPSLSPIPVVAAGGGGGAGAGTTGPGSVNAGGAGGTTGQAGGGDRWGGAGGTPENDPSTGGTGAPGGVGNRANGTAATSGSGGDGGSDTLLINRFSFGSGGGGGGGGFPGGGGGGSGRNSLEPNSFQAAGGGGGGGSFGGWVTAGANAGEGSAVLNWLR